MVDPSQNSCFGSNTAGGRAVIIAMVRAEEESLEAGRFERLEVSTEELAAGMREEIDRRLMGALAYMMITADELWRVICEYL